MLLRTRAEIAASLRSRRSDLEQAVLAKIRDGADVPAPDAEYVVGLRTAVTAALDCGLEVLAGGDPHAVSIPPALLLQARLAARAGVQPEAVVCRYTAGHTLLNDAIVAALAGHASLNPKSLQHLLAEQGALLDRVLASVSEEYRLEAARRQRPGSRRDQLVRRLLAGETIGTDELSYELDAWHIGVVASGAAAEPTLRGLARELDRHLLLLDHGQDSAWAWFGGQRRIGSEQVEQAAAAHWPVGITLAIGEPARRLPGWRLTNSQARAVAPLTRGAVQRVRRYADNALLSSMFQDGLFVHSMRQLYLDPLDPGRAGGRDLRRTLETYFATGRNTSSTASALGVTRKTVNARLERVEQRIGRPLSSCSLELEAALALDRVIVGE